MATTPNGLPYPLPSADLRLGAGDIQALATALDLQGTAKTPVTVALATNVSGLAGTIRVYRVGAAVLVDVDVSGATFADGASVVISGTAGVPAALRPTVGTRFGAAYMTSGYPGFVYVNTSGAVTVQHRSGANRSTARGVIVYPISDLGG